MYQRILVPIDGSSTASHGLDEAIRLAKLTHGRLRLVHVTDELSFAYAMDTYAGHEDDWLGTLRRAGTKLLVAAQAVAVEAGIEAETLLCDSLTGAVHEVVAAEAASWPADLIVIGTHGRRGFERLVMGSGAEQILRFSPVPVLLIRAPEAPQRHERRHSLVEEFKLPDGAVASG